MLEVQNASQSYKPVMKANNLFKKNLYMTHLFKITSLITNTSKQFIYQLSSLFNLSYRKCLEYSRKSINVSQIIHGTYFNKYVPVQTPSIYGNITAGVSTKLKTLQCRQLHAPSSLGSWYMYYFATAQTLRKLLGC